MACCSSPAPTLDDSVEIRSQSSRYTIECSHCGKDLGRISETVGPALEGLHRSGARLAAEFSTPHLTRRLVAIGFVALAGDKVALTPRGRQWCTDQFGG